jgi:N-methylhydantoinase A
MAGAIRLVSIERGYNPRQFAAMPFGGGGGLHVGALIKEVGLANALVPRFPGVTSALGCVIADMRHDFVRTINQMLDRLDVAQLDALMVEAAEKGLAQLQQAGVRFEGTAVEFEFDMSYLGQTHTVVVPLPLSLNGGTTGITSESLRAAFEIAYRGVYGRLLDNIAIRVLNLRIAVIGFRPKFDLAMLAPGADATVEAARLGKRRVWVEGGWHEAEIYARLELPVDAVIPGPALLEQPDTTIFIEPDLEAKVDRFGNLIVQRKVAS